MPIPPWSEVWDLLRLLVLPGLGASLVVMVAIRRTLGEKWGNVAAVLALGIGVFTANYFRKSLNWRIDSDRVLQIDDLKTTLAWSLEGKPKVEPAEDGTESTTLPTPPARYWLPWLAGAVMLLELALRFPRCPQMLIGIVRCFTAVFAARLLTPSDLRVEVPWLPWVFALVILLEWTVLVTLAARWQDGTVSACLILCCMAAAGVMLYAHSARFMDMAIYFGVALLGPTLVAWRWPSNTGACVVGASLFLAGLMISGQHETYSEVPIRSFAMVGLAPLAMTIMLIPRLSRLPGVLRCTVGIFLTGIPAGLGLLWALQKETVSF